MFLITDEKLNELLTDAWMAGYFGVSSGMDSDVSELIEDFKNNNNKQEVTDERPTSKVPNCS